ncbi:MAG: Fe-S cluster assembly protein SufD, partial [Acidobacteria bacterium]|nr:Fe-S cluster assembly protein SufD [Acidobacteriota bacterium]
MASKPLFQPDFASPAHPMKILATLGSKARDRFEELGFPSRRDEDWRLTSLAPVTDHQFAKAPEATVTTEGWTLPDAVIITFVNDRVVTEIDKGDLPPGVTITALSSAAATHPHLIENHLGRLARIDDQPFVALNTAQGLEGALIHLAPGTNLDRPLDIVYNTTGDDIVTYPRTLIIAEEGAKATVLETFVGDGRSLICPVTEVAVGPNTSLSHTRLVEINTEGSCVGSLSVTVDEHATYRLSSAALGGSLVRADIRVDLVGEGADTVLDGLTLVGGNEQGTAHVIVDHRVPNCTSTQRFRSVLDGRSKAVFTGRIIVAEDAQKTDARQSSRSLLRSSDAVAHNNPQLEIYADDVRCTHGSTVGQLDPEALFYLRARGIDRLTAEGLLTLAFAAEVLEGIPIEAVRSRLADQLTARLGQPSHQFSKRK